jgi:hypothetical protein
MRPITVEDGISDWAKRVLNRSQGSGIRAWLNRYAYPEILNVQLQRWQTEGASEGVQWESLNPDYARSKLKRFANYPGGGRKMLIATGRLYESMTGRSTESRKLVEENRITLASTVPYGGYVDDKRDITTLRDDTVERFADELLKYLMGA